MAGKDQFDEFLGGSESLPKDVHILKLVSSRSNEIAAMTYSIENPQQTKLVFQKLPVHMRRRVMSHNARRLPRRLREAHLNQMTKSGLPPKSKRPSRKYRRRPRNLLLEYNRRQRNKLWLETHIWHAKRFHMIEKWGYRIASHANDKCFKANYRAVAKHCLMQDISYYTCIEMTGPEDILKETLKPHCDPNQLTFGAKIYIRGTREGTLMFFKKNGYPRSPIGHVHFLWRPTESNLKIIWIWVHPSFLNDVLSEIISSFEFKSITATNNDGPTVSYSNDGDCKMNVLKNGLNRFRFYGPLTSSVLTTALQLPDLSDKFFTKMDCTTECEVEMLDLNEFGQEDGKTGERGDSTNMQTDSRNVAEAETPWHVDYYSNHENAESLEVQKQLWHALKTLESPSQLPPNIVLGFTVLDPRFFLPEKRTKAQKVENFSQAMPMPPTNANSSPIWETEIRRRVTKACVTTSAINKLRSKCLVPGVHNDKYFNEQIMAKIPILLIQRPGTRNTGLCSGIDVILPSGWAMPFWLAFIFRCVKVGALRESRSIPFEYQCRQSPDINEPDTPAYVTEALTTKLELMKKYFRYPPNRRVNFVKLGISSPFFCEWKMLMKEWTNSEDFYILRDRNLLTLLQKNISSYTSSKRKLAQLQERNLNEESISEYRNCLICVKVSILKKGCPKKFAIICIPTAEDLAKFQSNSNWPGPVEKLNTDPNENIRKTLRKNHLNLLKRLKRQRIRYRKAFLNKLSARLSEGISVLDQENKSKNLLETSREIINKQSRKMSQLYLPECTTVRQSCNREVMGYVTAGDFSFAEATGVGLGYVTLNSLMELIDQKHNTVLVRNTQTRQYRIAKLEIVI